MSKSEAVYFEMIIDGIKANLEQRKLERAH